MERTRRLVATTTLVLSACALGGAPALGALPRTYTVQRVDNPTPELNDRFGDGMVNAGDVNGDGEDDILVGIDEHGTVEGEVFVFSGEDGALIRRIPPPDPDAVNVGTSTNPDNPAAFGTFVGRIADIGSCPGFAGSPGADCTATQVQMDTGDGVPDQLASAIGVDVTDSAGDDMGMAYVLDGATGAVLKRIRMPASDRADQAANEPNASQGPAFGRTIIAPAGLPPCSGNAGIGACPPVANPTTPEPYGQPAAVRIGDLDGGGDADIVIGASDFTEKDTTNAACNNPGTAIDGGDKCLQAGRFYVYTGESLAGTAPSVPVETPFYTLKNPVAQFDDPTVNSRFHREAMGYSVAPVGDLGKCSTDTVSPGTYCLNTANTTTADGKPEFIASAHRTDTSGMGDVGVAFAIDGPTGRVLDVYNHPEPQVSSIFAFSNYNQPAVGDLGSNTKPDVYQGAMVHSVDFKAQGRGYVLSGDFRSGGANHYNIAVLDDPTPAKIGNFSTSSAGIGDVSGDSRRELMIGAYGPHAPQITDDVVSDVHIFSALSDQVLQTISDPDGQPGSGFGRALAPLGDLNDDGFLDFAVGAGGYDPAAAATCSPCTPTTPGAAQGRLYILRSDDSPAPAPPPPPPAAPPGTAGTGGALPAVAPTLAGRAIEIDVAPGALRRPGRVRLRGVLEAFANESSCVPGQRVLIQRRSAGSARYRTFARRTTDSDGDFALRFRVSRTTFYRARVGQTDTCHGAASARERATVRRAAGASR